MSSLLLHICCAPDEAWALNCIREQFDVTCFFCNPNIFPVDEYHTRLDEARSTAQRYSVPFVSDEYRPDAWKTATEGLHQTAEGKERCWPCYRIRLERAARYAKEHGFLQFGTVLSVSPHKNLLKIDEMGNICAQEHGVAYVPFAFRKNDGFNQSVLLSDKLGIYRQDYCGCILSLAERDKRNRRKQVL